MGTDFRTWLLEEAESHIQVNLPSVRQSHQFDCGPACLRSICTYFKVGPPTESAFIKACRSESEDGTRPADLMRCARSFGLQVRAKSHFTLDELKACLEAGRPVMCCIQAYGNRRKYDDNESGHYVVAIGLGAGKVYFEDPSMKGTRGSLPFAEFLKRWHDKDGDGRVYRRFGMVFWKGGGKEPQQLSKTKKIP